MFSFGDRLPVKDIGNGVLLKVLGAGNNLSVLHWDLQDGAVVPMHEHPEEQFGYVIRGGFEITIGDEKATLKAGDCYFIPAGVPHEFRTIGETEAIDVFSPARKNLPWAE